MHNNPLLLLILLRYGNMGAIWITTCSRQVHELLQRPSDRNTNEGVRIHIILQESQLNRLIRVAGCLVALSTRRSCLKVSKSLVPCAFMIDVSKWKKWEKAKVMQGSEADFRSLFPFSCARGPERQFLNWLVGWGGSTELVIIRVRSDCLRG